MSDDDDDRPLNLLQPSPPSAPGATTAIHLPTEAVEAVQHLLARGSDLIGTLSRPAAPSKGSSREAQALVSGLLQGLGARYQDDNLSKAGQGLEARALGLPPKAEPSKAKPISKAKKGPPRAARKARRGRSSK